jgi:hypothetical protein
VIGYLSSLSCINFWVSTNTNHMYIIYMSAYFLQFLKYFSDFHIGLGRYFKTFRTAVKILANMDKILWKLSHELILTICCIVAGTSAEDGMERPGFESMVDWTHNTLALTRGRSKVQATGPLSSGVCTVSAENSAISGSRVSSGIHGKRSVMFL